MKVLIIRFSSIGDIVLTTPVVRCLKQQLKDARIHYITKGPYSPIVDHNPYIDKVYAIGKNISEVAGLLKKEKYDFIVDLHHNLRSAQVKALLGKRSGSFPKLNIQKWLMVNLKINKLPGTHIVDRYMETVKELGVVNDGKGLEYFIPEKDAVDLKTLPPGFQNGYVAFVIGAKFFTKQLPKEKIASIIGKLQRPVVLLGGNEDVKKGEWIARSVSHRQPANGIYNACGKFNLNQSASLVKQAVKIITHDTGLMHIAAAFRKEIVSVWGNTIPEFGMYPYYGSEQVPGIKCEVPGLKCRPCSKLGYSECPKGHFKCMNEINEECIAMFLSR